MKKLIIALLVLGLIAVGTTFSNADSTRTINHNFRAVTAQSNQQSEPTTLTGGTIYRITGYATAANATFGIYNASSIYNLATTDVAVEGGEATSGDALPHMYFGEDGLTLSSGAVVVAFGCTVVIEYL